MIAAGQYARVFREAGGLSRARLAIDLGLDESTIVRFEQGSHRTSMDVAARLVRAVGASLETFADLLLIAQDDAAVGDQVARGELAFGRQLTRAEINQLQALAPDELDAVLQLAAALGRRAR